MQWQCLRHALVGPSSPRALVALFHGLGDNLATLRPLAERWRAQIPVCHRYSC